MKVARTLHANHFNISIFAAYGCNYYPSKGAVLRELLINYPVLFKNYSEPPLSSSSNSKFTFYLATWTRRTIFWSLGNCLQMTTWKSAVRQAIVYIHSQRKQQATVHLRSLCGAPISASFSLFWYHDISTIGENQSITIVTSKRMKLSGFVCFVGCGLHPTNLTSRIKGGSRIWFELESTEMKYLFFTGKSWFSLQTDS